MGISSFRRNTSRRVIRYLTFFLSLVLILDFYITLNGYKTFNRNLVANTYSRVDDLPTRARNQKIFIVAQFWTSARVIVDHWSDAVLNLVDVLGKDNIHLSILGSRGLDNTEEVLRWFDGVLEQRSIPKTTVLDPATHQDVIDAGPKFANGTAKQGWIPISNTNPPNEKELRRIPYLAEMRNRGLQPMLELHQKRGLKFDKILFLNDVIFKTSDILSLVATNTGIYDVACAIDFHDPPKYYDTFALRDVWGYPAATREFPYFRSKESRNAIMNGVPAPVKSCWNGMVVVDSAPYYDQPTELEAYDLDGKPVKTKEGLRFRGLPDGLATSHLEASECCLIHADLTDRGQAKKGIFMNPAVRVGYKESEGQTKTSYDLVHTGPSGIGFVTLREYFTGLWWNRYMRWTRPAWFDMRKIWWRVLQWKKAGEAIGERREEVGVFCTVDEMQILISNGWKHVW